MRNFTSVVIPPLVLLIMLATAGAGPLNTNGIPESSRSVIHLDLETGAKSRFIQTLRSLFLEPSTQGGTEWRKTLGFDPENDITDITIGLVPGRRRDDPPQGVFIVRGTFSPARILAAALQKNARTTTIGQYAFIDVGALPGLIPFGKKEKILFAAVDNKTLLLADAATAESALKALEGREKSYKAPADLTIFASQTGAPVITAHLDRSLFPASKGANTEEFAPPENVRLALGNDDREVKLRIAATFPLALDAQRARAKIQTFLGLLKMSRENRKETNDALAERLVKLHEATKISGTDKRFNIAVDLPSDDAAWLLGNIREKTKKQEPRTDLNSQ